MADDVILQVIEEPTYLIQQDEVTNILTEGLQGPPGLPGGTLYGTAGANIMAYQILVLLAGLIYPADPTDILHVGFVVGVARTSALTGQPVQYQVAGELTGASGLTAGRAYIGLSGVISPTPKAVGSAWRQQVGVVESSSKLVLGIRKPTINA